MSAIYISTAYEQDFTLNDRDGVAIDITSYTFKAQFRDNATDEEALLELTTANGGITVLDGPAGRMRFIITAVQSADLPEGRIVFDVLRLNGSPAPTWLFGGTIRVKQPVTR
jgi:hypothetical protein